jgi:hypothetical protein
MVFPEIVQRGGPVPQRVPDPWEGTRIHGRHKVVTCSLCVCVCVVLEFELRASHLTGRHSTTWTMPPTFFFFFRYFWIGSPIFWLGLASDCNPTTCVAGSVDMCHTPGFFYWEWGRGNLLTFFTRWWSLKTGQKTPSHLCPTREEFR